MTSLSRTTFAVSTGPTEHVRYLYPFIHVLNSQPSDLLAYPFYPSIVPPTVVLYVRSGSTPVRHHSYGTGPDDGVLCPTMRVSTRGPDRRYRFLFKRRQGRGIGSFGVTRPVLSFRHWRRPHPLFSLWTKEGKEGKGLPDYLRTVLSGPLGGFILPTTFDLAVLFVLLSLFTGNI